MQTENFSNLPKSWQVKTLGDIFLIERGGSPRPIKQFLTNDKNGINWIKIGDTKNVSKYITSTAEKIKPDGKKHSRFVEIGDLILSNSMSFGRPYIMKTTGCIHDGWVVFRNLKKLIDEEYAYYALTSNQIYAEFSKLATGSTVKNLSIDRIKQVAIPLPPLEIQKRIVARLDEAFARIDNGTKHLKTAKANLTKYKQSLLKSAFNGTLTDTLPHPKPLPQGEGLTFDSPSLADSALSCPPSPVEDNFTRSPSLAEGARGWVDSHNNTTHCHTEALQKAEVSQKSTNRDSSLTAFAQNDNKGNHRDISLSTKAQYDNNGKTPNLPQGWTIKTLGEVLSSDKHSMKRGPFGSSLKKEFFVDSGIRIFEQYNPINQDSEWKRYFITKEKFKELESFKAGAGDLLISCSGTLGKILELPQNVETGIINQALLKIRLDNKQILNRYFVHLFNSPNIQRIILENTIGSAIQNIASVKILKQIKIPLPPLQTQNQIVEILEKHFSSADKTGAFIDSALKNAKQLKSSLLKSAFAGELT